MAFWYKIRHNVVTSNASHNFTISKTACLTSWFACTFFPCCSIIAYLLLSRKPHSHIVKITKNFNYCALVLISFSDAALLLVWLDQTKSFAAFHFHFKPYIRSLIQSQSNLYISVTKADALKNFLVFNTRYQHQKDRTDINLHTS